MDLPSRLRACLEYWHLHSVSRLEGGFGSGVFASTSTSGDEVVLKLTPTPEAARREIAALGIWVGTGAAVQLIDVHLPQSALLLERIRPATHLPGNDDPVAIEATAGLLTRLHQVSPGGFPFARLEEIYNEMERRSREDAAYEQRTRGDPTRGAVGLHRLDAARAVAMNLCATTERPVLLHGGFLDKNLLWNGASYVAIDPIPCFGDPCSDIGFFAAGHPPVSGILPRAAAIDLLLAGGLEEEAESLLEVGARFLDGFALTGDVQLGAESNVTIALVFDDGGHPLGVLHGGLLC